MMHAVKIMIAEFLSAGWIGRIIAWIFSDKIPFHGTRILTHDQEVKNKTKALLFWKMYESSEVRFVNQYIDSSYDVVELGGSIGAVSIQLGKKIKGKKLISLEANPSLIGIQKENLLANGITSFQQIHAAYGSEKQTVWFALGEENTLGRIGEKGMDKGFFVETMSLQSIVAAYGLSDYALVCDIEGAEIDLLLHEQQALRMCKLLIIETHETVYKNRRYTPEEMKTLLLQMGFELIDQHGVNFVMRNKQSN
jgi:FkbM family methyltransferase